MDNIRIGSFMAIQLREDDEDSKEITIARLEERVKDEDDDPDSEKTTIRIRLFLPLFRSNRLKWYPNLPSHTRNKIQNGCGSKNDEVYESREVLWIDGEKPDYKVKLLFRVFVFTLRELERSGNAWAEGMCNVYVVRFWHNTINSYVKPTRHRLEELPPTVTMGFPNTHPGYDHPSNLVVPRRCLHRSIWIGLYNLQKKMDKELNKLGGLSTTSTQREVSLKVGYYFPNECIQYIHTVANSVVSRQSLVMSCHGGILSFEKHEDLLYLNSLFGKHASSSSGVRSIPVGGSISEKPLKRRLHLNNDAEKENAEKNDKKESSVADASDDGKRRRCDERK